MLLGPQCDSGPCHLINKPRAIIVNFDEPLLDVPVVLGAWPQSPPQDSCAPGFKFPGGRGVRFPCRETMYRSYAPLAGISCAYLFEDSNTGCCRGIIFQYANGGSRAVGQCRIGVDRCTEYRWPSTICSRSRMQDRFNSGVQVEVGTCSPRHHQERWTCWCLDKTVYFWFKKAFTMLLVL